MAGTGLEKISYASASAGLEEITVITPTAFFGGLMAVAGVVMLSAGIVTRAIAYRQAAERVVSELYPPRQTRE